MMESEVLYEEESSSPGAAFELGGALSWATGLSSGGRNDVALQELGGALLLPGRPSPGASGDDDSDESDEEEWLHSRKVRALKFIIGCTICVVVGLTIGVVILIRIPWGKAAYSEQLIQVVEQFANASWRVTTSCLYKQFNDGPFSSGPQALGLNDMQFSHEGRSPDILFYHHQGNVLELTGPNNATTWLQITFNRKGLAWRHSPLPQPYDTLRYTKECYWKCGTVPRAHRNLSFFQAFLVTQKHEHYNGFLLNCLQFSKRLHESLRPINLGCAPAELVDRAQLAAARFPHEAFEDPDFNESLSALQDEANWKEDAAKEKAKEEAKKKAAEAAAG